MISTLLVALAVAAPAAASGEAQIAAIRAAERLALPRGPALAVEVDPLGARVTLRGPRDLRGLAARLRGELGTLCPKIELEDGAIALRCRTRRLAARLTENKGRRFLDLFELQGLPVRGGPDELRVFYPPLSLRFGAPCPGSTPAGRGECLLAAGDLVEAAVQLRLGVDTVDRPVAALRLGDLAVAQGAFATAIGWYQRAGVTGPFGRMATARLCELGGGCLDEPRPAAFEAAALPEPLRTEMLLRGARAAAYVGRPDEVIRLVERVLPPQGTAGGCDAVGALFCRRLVLFALEEAPPEHASAAVELYLALPARLTGPLAAELGAAASARAVGMGAPIFAANVLASVASTVPHDKLAAHLLRSAELYVAGDDLVRARVILEYAESRFPSREITGARWAAVRRAVRRESPDLPPREKRPALPEIEALGAEVTKDVAAAWGAVARSRGRAR